MTKAKVEAIKGALDKNPDIELTFQNANDNDLELISGLRKLKVLKISRSPNAKRVVLTAKGLAHLKGLTSLEELDLSWHMAIGDGCVAVCRSAKERMVERSNNLSKSFWKDGGRSSVDAVQAESTNHLKVLEK